MDWLWKVMLPMIVEKVGAFLTAVLSPEKLREYGDKILDLIEDLVDSTETEIDDALVEPLVKRIRETFNIPDNDPVAPPTDDQPEQPAEPNSQPEG